ncbi:unnamed protein product [marine sediment metagenome]|uniref:Uncharacterized protein n=1 Tax=marine sediment metagenome TaxID=412755 RepID=X1S1X7_9ZZZZ
MGLLAEAGFMSERSSAYAQHRFSKGVKALYKFGDPKDAIIFDGRYTDTFERDIQQSCKPEEFRALLIKHGVKRTTAIRMVQNVF